MSSRKSSKTSPHISSATLRIWPTGCFTFPAADRCRTSRSTKTRHGISPANELTSTRRTVVQHDPSVRVTPRVRGRRTRRGEAKRHSEVEAGLGKHPCRQRSGWPEGTADQWHPRLTVRPLRESRLRLCVALTVSSQALLVQFGPESDHDEQRRHDTPNQEPRAQADVLEERGERPDPDDECDDQPIVPIVVDVGTLTKSDRIDDRRGQGCDPDRLESSTREEHDHTDPEHDQRGNAEYFSQGNELAVDIITDALAAAPGAESALVENVAQVAVDPQLPEPRHNDG